ncbi:MAG TPA: DUF2207 domain-containing protein [Allosphingosinicella sp.]|nr:DUF2207 domain-containing protein [Allosphingosinicella sp.]
MIQIWRYLALIALFTLSSTAPAQPGSSASRERILSYSSDIQIGRDAALDVTETIRIAARGDEFRHGIYRDFPTRARRSGGIAEAGFEVAGVTRDGRPEPWRRERIDGGVRIRIGDANVFLRPGTHTYRIRYRTTRQIGFLEDRDELYWNVTGNDWAFAIDHAEARVRLPARVRFGSRSVYTGARGSSQADARVTTERPGDIRIATTRRLEPGEGLTIAIAWRKGVVRPPRP